jgi:hypothetical protein
VSAPRRLEWNGGCYLAGDDGERRQAMKRWKTLVAAGSLVGWTITAAAVEGQCGWGRIRGRVQL